MSAIDLFAPSSETRRLAVNLTKEDVMKIGMTETQAHNFLRLRERFLRKTAVEWDEVRPAPDEFFYQYRDLKESTKQLTKEALNKVVVVALNGGLGASMGIKGAKSNLRILKNELTFLDCKVRQIEELNNEYDIDVPLVLMNSFNTQEETLKTIQKYKNHRVSIFTFEQSKYPLMFRDTMDIVPSSDQDRKNFYPPGSGEVFRAFNASGLLEEFKKKGKEYMFVCNVENLGADVDPKILNFFIQSEYHCLLEVTNRISSDNKGGFPVMYKDKRVHILEISQIPYSDLSKFPIGTYKWFNTNNIWVRMTPLENMLKLKEIDLDFVVKQRILPGGKNAVQIETPACMSIHSFSKSSAICVPRRRHRPVKTTSDLLQAQSDMFFLDKGLLLMNPKRPPDSFPVVKLGEAFQKLEDYEKRFKSIPNILELDHLTVSGDVYFGANVTLKGTVIIVAETGSRLDIPDNTVLENKVVSGWLQMSDY